MVGAVVEPDEVETFQKFKKYIRDSSLEDGTLIRFLRATDFNFSRAKENLQDAIEWRSKWDIDNHLTWEFPENYATDMPYRYFGTDFEGAPICWAQPTRWPLKKLIDQGESDGLRKWSFSMFEHGLQQTIIHGSTGNIVLDIEGLTFVQASHLPSLRFLYEGCVICERFYPESIKSLTIINAPWIFSIVFNFLRGIITARTMEKVRIFNSKEEWCTDFTERFPISSIIPEIREKML